MRARDHFERISYGYEGGVSRPSNKYADRRLRDLINQANKKGDCIISARGRYYRLRHYIPAEAFEYRAYMRSDASRAKDIMYKDSRMKRAYERRRREWEKQNERRGSAESANSPGSSGIMDIRVEEDSSFPGQMVMRM
ncbi:hypothetical protein [Qiania dongpingensis]|uniref:hypothetical protein n=1 Tax=Qiania dongpingensis TaxID=2763669 RepID=UPI002015F080|nr:hypothetical protein [Qiania dongpingensis]